MTKQIAVWLVVSFLATAAGWCSDVTLKSKPSNAVVFNDQNIKQGETPLYMGPYIRTKYYQVRKKGYLPQDVTINMWSPSVIEVELQEDPNAKTETTLSTKILRDADNDGGEVADASADTLKRLRALKTIRDGGDISEEEYSTMRTRILNTLIPPETQDPSRASDASQSVDASETVAPRKAASTPRTPLAPVDEPRFGITCSVADDTAGGVAIIGNGDGRVQPGEVFDLVVVVSNVSTSALKAVTCTVTLPEDTSLKAFSELHQTVSELVTAAATTNRFNLAMPLNATVTMEPVCSIDVSEKGTPAVVRTEYSLPVEPSFPGTP